MRIIDRLRYNQLIKSIPSVPTSTKENPLLKKQLEQTQKDLNLILNKWNWGKWKPKTAQEFIDKFGGWVNEQIEKQKELNNFLKEHSADSLDQLKTTWTNTVTDYRKEIEELKRKEKSELSEELKNKLESYEELEKKTKEARDKLKSFFSKYKVNSLSELETEIENLKKSKTSLTDEQQEKLAEYDNLEIERDELKRDKTSLEQDNIAINNRLKLKQEEVNSKDRELDRVKKEKENKEKSLNDKIKELKKEQKELQEKYKKKVKQSDEDSSEINKLEDEIEKLNRKVGELEKERKELLKYKPDEL